MGLPYFWSAQLDGTQDQMDNPKDSSRLEGWIGLLVFNVAVWVTVVGLDIHLLATEFKHQHTQINVLQTGALVSVCVAAGTMIFFTLLHYANEDRPFSSGDGKEARVLPPFATALISGGLKATLGFTYVVLLLNSTALGHDTEALKVIVAQICLKHFGSAMALANARLKVYTSMHVVNAV